MPHETRRSGLEYLTAVTRLLQHVRSTHPTAGLYEAADFQWWWRTERPTDSVPQLFWVDDLDRPVAAAVLTQWDDRVALDVIALPDASSDWTIHVMERGLAAVEALGPATVSLELASTDTALRQFLDGQGFVLDEEGIVECWLDADARPPVAEGADGYRLLDRTQATNRRHHLAQRSTPEVEARLQQTSLYRPDLDIVVVDEEDRPAAYGLFWFDPTTATGLVEPMRTEDDHQRRGLARLVLTTGVDRLARLGAQRIKICFEVGNPAARNLYLDVGFVPDRQTVILTRDPA